MAGCAGSLRRTGTGEADLLLEEASMKRATDRSDIPGTARDRDIRLEDFAAELTIAAYPVVLRRQPKASWLKVELALWRALAETVRRWARQRPAAASADELAAWREGLLVDLTESAFFIALKSGIKRSLLQLELGLYQAFRLAIGRRRRAG
jgi:hypothetical protein